MSTVGSSVITSPTEGSADFHLFAVNCDALSQSLLYVPLSSSPALTTDLIRADRVSTSPLALDEIAQNWLAHYVRFADGATVRVEIVRTSSQEVLFHAGFFNPIIRDHHTVLRYVRAKDHDFALQFIRKLDPVTEADVAQRIEFLAGCTIPPDPHSAASRPYTEYATEAQRHSEEIEQLLSRVAISTREHDVAVDVIGALLAAASPLHHAAQWAFWGGSSVGACSMMG